MSKINVLATFLCGTAALWVCDTGRGDDPAAAEFGVSDLFKLPDDDYKADPYLGAARSLQTAGKEKARTLLLELAGRDGWPHTRTVTLCRMLFKAKRGSIFEPPAIGGVWFCPGGTTAEDWPLQPIAIVDGVPFRIAGAYVLGGHPEDPADYVAYCVKECDWNDFKYEPKSMEQKKKALEDLYKLPKLKGKLTDDDKEFLEAQIK